MDLYYLSLEINLQHTNILMNYFPARYALAFGRGYLQA